MWRLCAKFASVLGVVFAYLRLTPTPPLRTAAVWDPYIRAFRLFRLLYTLLPNIKIHVPLSYPTISSQLFLQHTISLTLSLHVFSVGPGCIDQGTFLPCPYIQPSHIHRSCSYIDSGPPRTEIRDDYTLCSSPCTWIMVDSQFVPLEGVNCSVADSTLLVNMHEWWAPDRRNHT